jgi:hypothetical protein
MRRLTVRWQEMSPQERTELIQKMRLEREPIRFAMIDAWNHYPELIKELSAFLKSQQILKPVDLLYSSEEFSEFQSRVMTEFWATHRDMAEIFGDKIKLLYNDNNEGNREKQRTFKTVIDNIKDYEREHGVKLIDGFGMQCHFWGSEDEDKNFMEEMFQQCSRFGVELQVTEFDVSNHSTKEIQQSIFNNFVEVAQKKGIEIFTTWGLNDIVSWLHGEEASLVDSNCDLKPFTMKYIKAFSERYKNASV